MTSPPVIIDSDTALTAMPFDWSQFLIDLRRASISSDGVLVSRALGGVEFNVNIAFGAYKGTLQPERIGAASVSPTHI